LSRALAKVHLLTLGCPKNQVDSEIMLGQLARAGHEVVLDPDEADVLVVNTCAFVADAKQESIDAVLEAARMKTARAGRRLVVSGCLAQRYASELPGLLPEVDAFVGTGEFPRIAAILDEALAKPAGSSRRRGRAIYVDAGRTHLYDDRSPRLLVGPPHSAYVKIAEGCDRVCAFCAIPAIRGRFQSRTPASVVAEARQLASGGAREINLVAQDSTSWGKDLPGRPKLPSLLRTLDAVDGLDWIRLLYVYPSAVSDDLIEVLATGRRVLPYVDVPLQHASDAMLRAMRRGTTAERQRRLVERLRGGIPDLTLRTTLIVGFPGEREADFEALCDFVRDVRFDRVGVFRYSDEEGTAAHALAGKVPTQVARERQRVLVGLLREIQREKLRELVGREVELLIDAGGRDRARGRMRSQAPEIDGEVLLRGAATTGEMLRARITNARGADLSAEPVAPEQGNHLEHPSEVSS
jgi:ribosomal protein S12 methylthiotransferase